MSFANEKGPQVLLEAFEIVHGAGYRIRTDDLPLTRRLLYQLS